MKIKRLLLYLLLLIPVVSYAQNIEELSAKSDAHYYNQRYDSALYYALKAETEVINKYGINSHNYAYFAGQFLAMNYEALGALNSALHWYRKSIDIFQNLNDTLSTNYGETLANYGNLCTNLNLFSEALPALLAAEKIFTPYKDSAAAFNAYGGTKNNLANVYLNTGYYSSAIDYYLQLLQHIRKLYSNGSYYEAKVLSNLAKVYAQSGLHNQARHNFLIACKMLKKVSATKNDYYGVYYSLGQLYAVSKEKQDSALHIFNEVLDSVSLTNNLKLYNACLNGIGVVKQLQRKFDEAEDILIRAIRISKDVNTQKESDYLISLSNLALLYSARGHYRQADSIYQVITAANFSDENISYDSYWKMATEYTANLIRLNKFEEAGKQLKALTTRQLDFIYRNFAGMPENDKFKFTNTIQSGFDLFYSWLAKSKLQDTSARIYAFNNLLKLKGIILSAQTTLLRQVRQTNDQEVRLNYNKWLHIREVLYQQYSRSNAAVFAIDSLEAIANVLERKLWAKGITLTEPSYNFHEIKNSLQSREAVIEFVTYRMQLQKGDEIYYGAFVLRKKEAAPRFIVLGKESKLKKLLINSTDKTFDANRQLKKLYQSKNLQLYYFIWKAIEPFLQDVNKVYYSPAGMINYLSLNAINLPDGRLLMDKYQLSQLFNSYSLTEKQTKNFNNVSTVNLWGNMNYSAKVATDSNPGKTTLIRKERAIISDETKGGLTSFSNLKADETDNLKHLLRRNNTQTNLYEGVEANETAFKEKARHFKGIVHISTHGFYSPYKKTKVLSGLEFENKPNPLLRNGLIFSGANHFIKGNNDSSLQDDGILTAYEIAQLDLSFVNLVVLSACETGLGDIDPGNEGVLGLQRAFRMAGVKKLLVSLWRVPPKQTADLMILFYKNLIKGEPPASALLQAQKVMRKKFPPYYWSGFVLIE